ncbi:MAG: TIGR04283 family arsenosugar biosynthesis glycosyltransferase [Erythrobacter sp.]|nr:TIGR04283 family arsenosugar biosynthesis glycosyltransferase [Erythrobacter sp.]
MTISVIIPAINEADKIGRTLVDVLALDDEIEVIVVDGGSSDGTERIAADHGAIVKSSRPGRARQMNLGAELSTGDVLFFLHADTLPPPNATAAIAEALSDPKVAGGSFRIQFDLDHPVLRFSSWMSRINSPFCHYGDSGYFVRRQDFFELGGYRDIPILEDFDFLRRLSRERGMGIIEEPVMTSARRFVANGVVKLQLLGILIVWLYLMNVSPYALRRLYNWAQ